MTTSTFNIRLDDELRTQATQVLSGYGLTPTQAIKLFFNQVVRTNAVPLSFDYDQVLKPNLVTQRAIDELESGGGTRYDSLDDLLNGVEKSC